MRKALHLLFFLFCLQIGSSVLSISNCSTGCQVCTNATQCDECYVEHVLLKGRCFTCPQGCRECSYSSGQIVCDTCMTEYQIDANGKCFKCKPNCLTCSGKPQNCTDCHQGQVLEDKGSYSSCIANASCKAGHCAQCSDLSQFLCENCKQGLFSFKGYCIPCRFPFARCAFPYDNIFDFQIKPFILELRNTSSSSVGGGGGSRRRTLTALPHIDIANDDLQTVSQQLKEFWILGRHLYKIIEDLNVTTDDLQRTLMVQEIVNEQIDIYLVPLQVRKTTMIRAFRKQTRRKRITQQFLFDQIQEKFTQSTIGISCRRGWAFNSSSGQCIHCPLSCVECDMNSCFECLPTTNLTLDNSSCLYCQPPCQRCQIGNSTACITCWPPFKLNPNTKQCVECAKQCESCTPGNPNQCTQCRYPNSLTPTSNGTCYRCQDFKCKRCDPDNVTLCYECTQGFNLINNQCRQCQKGCVDCDQSTSPPTCYACKKGAVLKNNVCRRCVRGCVQCQQTDPKICIVAFPGLYVNQLGKPKKCPKQCETCGNDRKCLQYKGGLAQFKGQVVFCRKGCDRCDPLGPQTCLDCQDKGFYLDGTKCKRCSPGCKFCSDNTTCTQCRNRFVLESNACLKCNKTCLTCSESDQNECLSCRKGLTLDGTNCVKKCQKGCRECNADNTSICLECHEGRTLRFNGKCIKCISTCNGNCDPKDPSKCLSCTDGYELRDNICVRCPAGCEKCIEGQCQECRPNFDLKQINDKFVCKKKCKFPCQQCNGKKCLQCAKNFKKVSGKCVPDISCNPNCDYCPPGSYKDSGSCVQCSQNCADCDASKCFECVDGFYNDEGACRACKGNCLVCDNEDTCTQCKDGFFLQLDAETDETKTYGGQCVKCSNDCRTCFDDQTFCLSCNSDKTLNSTKCIGRFLVRFEFTLDFDYTKFLEDYQLQTLIEAVADLLNKDSDDIVVNQLYEGSTTVSATVSTDSQDEASSTASDLSSGTGSLGYTMLSSSVDVYYDGSTYTAAQTSNNTLGIIIGCSFGGVAILAIIIAGLCSCKKNRQNKVDNEEYTTKRRKEESFYEIKVENFD